MIGVADSRAALDGVSVIDLATYLAAPLCATLLGEFGAEVIKVEQPRVGDDLRRLGRAVSPSGGGSYWWFVEARNKKSITCNLRDPEGQALIQRLVAGSNVVTENFRPGTLERWNLGWDELSRARRSLVMVRISAFGQTGPNRERPGFGRIAAAFGGLAYLSGYPDRAPVSPGTPTVPDYLAGVFGAVLARRERARPLRGCARARPRQHRLARAPAAGPDRDAGRRPAVIADAGTDRGRRAVQTRSAQRGDLRREARALERRHDGAPRARRHLTRPACARSWSVATTRFERRFRSSAVSWGRFRMSHSSRSSLRTSSSTSSDATAVADRRAPPRRIPISPRGSPSPIRFSTFSVPSNLRRISTVPA